MHILWTEKVFHEKMFIAVLFIWAEYLKQSKCSVIGEYFKWLWNTNIVSDAQLCKH